MSISSSIIAVVPKNHHVLILMENKMSYFNLLQINLYPRQTKNVKTDVGSKVKIELLNPTVAVGKIGPK